MKKNDIAIVEIIDIGSNGEGIGKVDGFTLFIKDAIVGDTVEVKVMKAKKAYGYGRIVKVVEPSPYRVEPVCSVAKQCGGCQIQEMSYEKQLEFKNKKVKNNLQRIGGFSEELLEKVMQPIIGMDKPVAYRNKAQFPFATNKVGEVITGFYAQGTHSIIANTDCAIGAAVNEEVLKIVLAFMKRENLSAYDETTGKGLLRHVLIRYGFVTKEVMVCFVVNGAKFPKSDILAEELMKIEGMKSICKSVNKKNTNVIMGETYTTIAGQAYITDYIGDVKYQISPLSFFQVNPIQTKELYGKALEYAGLTGEETVWDLYCGIGTISLFLAQKAKKVYGVEIIPQAIDDARNNAKINDMSNVEFFVGKAEEVLPREYAENKVYADVIVVDPPRKGCDESLLATMVEMAPERIVYVSCDSATLARDMKYLCGEGYGVEQVTAVDMFAHTVHCESVCLMSKVKLD
ncbi:MAG: 23S rRNA (uracil(1939)-C(5))-methyltransferase RlmD [Eubacteriales bacterium]